MKALILIIFGGMFLFVVTWIYQESKKTYRRNLNKYEIAYYVISESIDKYDVSDDNYKKIMFMILDLSRMKHKNREKTSVLTLKFQRKFMLYHFD